MNIFVANPTDAFSSKDPCGNNSAFVKITVIAKITTSQYLNQ